MIKKMHCFILTSLLEKFARISADFTWDKHCLILFGEPDIEIPNEQ